MDTKQALDILIAVGICGITSVNITCSDCPLYTDDDEESPIHCKSWTDEDVAEAIRLLKDVKVLDPNPAIPGEWVLAKMLSVNTEPETVYPVDDIQIVDNVPIYIPCHEEKSKKETSERDKAIRRLRKRFDI